MGGSQSIPTIDTNIYNCKPSYLHLKDKYVNINTIVDTSSIDIKNHVDLRTNAPPLLDMGIIPSNVVCSVCSILHYMLVKQNIQGFPPSRAFILYFLMKMKNTNTLNVECSIKDVFNIIEDYGICPETQYQYHINTTDNPPDDDMLFYARKYRYINYEKVENKLNIIKILLQQEYPLLIGFTMYQELDRIKDTIWMPREEDQLLGGFTGVVVGFIEQKRVFIVQFPLSKHFGEHGYALIPYEYIENPHLTFEIWKVEFDKRRVDGEQLRYEIPATRPRTEINDTKSVFGIWES